MHGWPTKPLKHIWCVRASIAGTMGIWISRLMAVFGEKEARILVLGLDNAGKTTILCECLPTPGCRGALFGKLAKVHTCESGVGPLSGHSMLISCRGNNNSIQMSCI